MGKMLEWTGCYPLDCYDYKSTYGAINIIPFGGILVLKSYEIDSQNGVIATIFELEGMVYFCPKKQNRQPNGCFISNWRSIYSLTNGVRVNPHKYTFVQRLIMGKNFTTCP